MISFEEKNSIMNEIGMLFFKKKTSAYEDVIAREIIGSMANKEKAEALEHQYFEHPFRQTHRVDDEEEGISFSELIFVPFQKPTTPKLLLDDLLTGSFHHQGQLFTYRIEASDGILLSLRVQPETGSNPRY